MCDRGFRNCKRQLRETRNVFLYVVFMSNTLISDLCPPAVSSCPLCQFSLRPGSFYSSGSHLHMQHKQLECVHAFKDELLAH